MAEIQPSPMARLTVDLKAIVQNWRNLNELSGKAGAAIKANAYGLGVKEVAKALYDAGCRDFFVANWNEADQLKSIIAENTISVLNGIDDDNLAYANAHAFKPVLNTIEQINIWRKHGAGPCDVMLDTGINRLGIAEPQLSADIFEGLNIDICMSHMASADEDVAQNEAQRKNFDAITQSITCKRKSLSNSAAIALGKNYHYDLTRPGLSLYGGVPRSELGDIIAPVLKIEAKVLQVRQVYKGDKIGYNGTYICEKDMKIATAALGYADGYLRAFSNAGYAYFDDISIPIIGRVSMDLIILDVSNVPNMSEKNWLTVDFNLPLASKISNISQYELLTGLGKRYQRLYV